MDINELLKLNVERKASDLHLSVGLPPIMRIDGDLQHVADYPVLDEAILLEVLRVIANEKQIKEFNERLEIDFSYAVEGLARFRVNAFHQSRGIAMVFRTIPSKIPSMEDLHLPSVFKEIADASQGLVLITGPTGSGKSTTLAAILDYINSKDPYHILTIEDPIEFTHPSKQCLVNQREIHRDTISFNDALRSALREDPDIILVGEMRDLETIRLALTAAETGHLVFGTLHTSSAAKTINRIIDVFPGDEKPMVRSMLSESLQAVVCQTLLKKVGGGRVAALEIMRCNPAIRNLIREDKVAQMYSCIQTGAAIGMQTLDQHLQALVKSGAIDKETAHAFAVSKEQFV
jgi:twitching motility protein PilT